MVKIFIDSGHGGKDPGAVGNGLYEKNVVLDLAKRVEAKLKQYKGVEILQSRTTDVFLELSERADKANNWGADCFISLHLNAASDASAKGFETYVYNGSIGPETIAFQNVIHEEILRQIGANVRDRGKKRANFAVLRETNMIALLGENLFVTNSGEAALLKQTTFLEKVAQGYVTGLERFYGLIKETRPPTNNTPQTGVLYQVIAGTFSNRENAENHVKKLASQGYSAYIQEKQ
jgi:N-acetylmuramoyl-L-alanine amidase